MNTQTFFLLIVGGIALFFALLAVREFLLLIRIPRGHPDRGMYFSNLFILPICAVGVLFLGHIIDTKRILIEEIISTPPATEYAIFRNGLFEDREWVFVSTETPLAVRDFYRQYARTKQIPFMEDERDAMRMSFALSSGNLFLTLEVEEIQTVLYFSRDGKIESITTE